MMYLYWLISKFYAEKLPIYLDSLLVHIYMLVDLLVVQYRIISIWFRNKELAFAFGTVLAFSRLGSVLNFLLTSNFAMKHGIVWTLWGGRIIHIPI